MIERPILFNTTMVRAILAGTKTQTRRVVKSRAWAADSWPVDDDHWPMAGGGHPEYKRIACPFGRRGDRFWVREMIVSGDPVDVTDPDSYCASFYAADGAQTKADAWPWQRRVLPSIHMPRGLRRITLEITDVHVERLQDISEEDARDEGCDAWVIGHGPVSGLDEPGLRSDATYRVGFEHLWNSINGGDAWDANPYVWVVEFNRVAP